MGTFTTIKFVTCTLSFNPKNVYFVLKFSSIVSEISKMLQWLAKPAKSPSFSINQITPKIYISGSDWAQYHDALKTHGITHILSLHHDNQVKNFKKSSKFKYFHISDIVDTPEFSQQP